MRIIILLGLFLKLINLHAQQAQVDSLYRLIETSSSDSAKIQWLKDAFSLVNRSDYHQGQTIAKDLIQLARTSGQSDQLIYGYQFLGNLHSLANRPDSAFYYFKIVEEVARKGLSESGFATSMRVWGAYYTNLYQLDSGLYYNQMSLEAFRKIGFERDVIVQQQAVAAILIEQGAFAQAIDPLTEAILYYESQENWGFLSQTYCDLGRIYDFMEDRKRAIEYYEQSYRTGKKANLPRETGVAIYNIANVSLHEGAYEKAKTGFLEAYELFQQINAQVFVAATMGSLGVVYTHFKNSDSIDYYFQSGIALLHKLKTTQQLDILHNDYGYALIQIGKYPEALEQLDFALALAEPDSNLRKMESIFENKSEVYERWGKSLQALQEIKKAYQVREQRFQDDILEKVTDAETKYQTQKTQTELVKSQLKLAEEQTKTLIITGIGLLVMLLLGIVFWTINTRRKAREKEAQLALDLKESEAANLRELDQLKSRFFANISHEFRTPLTLILGPLQKLLNSSEPGQPDTFYHLMQRNANRLLDLINQLLDLSKLEAGKLNLQPLQADVVPFLRMLAGNFESLAADKHIRYHCKFPPHPVVMTFDKDKLDKTISNLLSNAFKYTPDEGDIWFEAEQQENDLCLTVTDTGIGMDEEQVEHVFDRFYQAGSDHFGSSGIGLALVKELVDLFEGKISLSSQPGEGSRFVVRLPILRDETVAVSEVFPVNSPPISSTKPSPLIVSSNESKGAMPQVLLVEDNPDVRAYLNSCLQDRYKLLEAEDGQEGLELAQKYMPDLIISDVMMPRMDGNALSAAIKSDQRTSHIPLILLTAKAGRESRIEGLQTGADDYLAKPFDEEELHIRVQNLIDQRKRLREQFGKNIVRLTPEEVLVESADQAFLKRVIEVIEQYMGDESFTIEDLGRELGMSRVHLHRKLKALTDQSPSVFLRTLRLKRGQQLLLEKVGNVAEIAYQVGFSSQAYFSKCFKDQFGISPSEVQ
ncbi:MAG: ATP-binding protein [Bacteroidota bacterium]